MDDIFVEPHKVVIRPKMYSNAIYIVLMGKISHMPNNPRTANILR